jgi:predicted nucleic acid-binding protein
MIAFFDTCVHVALLRGEIPLETVLRDGALGPVRLSPVVGHELLRGTRGRAAKAVEQLVGTLVPIEPPSWRTAFLESARLLQRVFADHEAIGLARLQNDALIAWTARQTGATLVTFDRHFEGLRRHIVFPLLLLQRS